MKDRIFNIVGPSGSGKTTIAKELEKLGYNIIHSYTTRPPRYEGEWGHTFIDKLVEKEGAITGYDKEELIPSFRLDQLWEFIEDILEEYVEVQFIADEYAITATFSGELLAWEEDKLQSFWKASIKVAEASLKESEK